MILPKTFCKNTVTHSFCGASVILKCLTLWSSWSLLLGNYDVKALDMTTWQHTICCLWPSLKCLKCSHASVNLFFWSSILCGLTSVLRSWLAFQMFVCSASCHQFKNQRHTHSTHRWTKIHCLSLACPAGSASVWWHTRLNRACVFECFFFLFFLSFSDWPTVDSLGAIVLLEAARPSALYSASLHNLPPCVCPSSVSHRSVRCSWKLHHALLWLAVKVVIACTPCLTVVCFYLSQKLHNVVTGD